MAEMIKRTVKVTIEKEIEVTFPAEWASAENIKEWCEGLWHIDGADDIAKYAARMAAYYGGGGDHDGIRRLVEEGMEKFLEPGQPYMTFRELYDEAEEEIIDGQKEG